MTKFGPMLFDQYEDLNFKHPLRNTLIVDLSLNNLGIIDFVF